MISLRIPANRMHFVAPLYAIGQFMCQFVQRTLTLSTILMATTLLCNDGHDAWASRHAQQQIQLHYLNQGIAKEFGIQLGDTQRSYISDKQKTIANVLKQFLWQERAAGHAVAEADIDYVISAHKAGHRDQDLLDEAARLKQAAAGQAGVGAGQGLGQQGGVPAPAQSGAAQSLQAGVGPYPLAMPLQHGLAAGLQGVDGSVDAVIRGLFGRGKVQRAVDVDGGTAITAQHRAAVEALKRIVVIDDNHIPAGQFVRAMRLVTVGFESFDLSHLLAVWKLQKGYGERGDHDYRAPLAYSAITADDVWAMVVLTTNRGGRFDVRDLGEELCGVRLEEPSDLMIEAVKGLWRLRDEGFRETFGTAEIMAYYALKQQRSGQVYGAPPLRREPTVEQIRAVVDLRRVLNGYAVGEPEREVYRREVVWRIRRDGGRIPGALAADVCDSTRGCGGLTAVSPRGPRAGDVSGASSCSKRPDRRRPSPHPHRPRPTPMSLNLPLLMWIDY